MTSSGHNIGGRSGASASALKSMERRIDELPLLPQVLVKILQLDPTSDDYFEQFEELAKEDPAFAVRVVAIANSAASAPAVPICTIRDSLSRMGAGTVSNLVASLSVQRVFMPTAPSQVRLWKHAIETAVSSQTISRLVPELEIDPAQAYLTGLLHDIGRFVMLEHAAPESQRVDDSEWSSPEELVQADIDVYNFTHSELGYLACKRWGLPESVADVIRAHHDLISDPVSSGSVVAAISCVQVADRIGIFLLDVSSTEELSDEETSDLILNNCVRTEDERSRFPVSTLCAAIATNRAESTRLLSGLGFA